MNRSNDALHALIHDAHEHYDILFIQEPWWGEVGGGQLASVKPGAGWRTLLPQRGAGANRPRVITYYRKRRDYTVVPRYDLIDDADAMAVEVRRAGAPPALFVNIYNQRPPEAGARTGDRADVHNTFQRVLARERGPVLPRDRAVVLLGDFNEHHPWWQSMSGTPRPQARELADWLRENLYSLENAYDEPTYASHATGATSVLDLVFSNPAAVRDGTVHNFRVDAAATGGSDHFGLLWSSAPTAAQVTNVTGCQYNWKKADEERFKELVRARLDETGAIVRLVMDEAYMPDDDELERAARCFMDALSYAAERAAPARRESTMAKPWWNGKLDEAKAALATAKRAQRGLQHQAAKAQAAVVRKLTNRFKQMVKRVKRRYFRDLLAGASTKDIWEYKGWTGGKRSYPTPPLSRGPGLPPVAEHQEKCDLLRQAHFRPPADLGVEMPDLAAPRPQHQEKHFATED